MNEFSNKSDNKHHHSTITGYLATDMNVPLNSTPSIPFTLSNGRSFLGGNSVTEKGVDIVSSKSNDFVTTADRTCWFGGSSSVQSRINLQMSVPNSTDQQSSASSVPSCTLLDLTAHSKIGLKSTPVIRPVPFRLRMPTPCLAPGCHNTNQNYRMMCTDLPHRPIMRDFNGLQYTSPYVYTGEQPVVPPILHVAYPSQTINENQVMMQIDWPRMPCMLVPSENSAFVRTQLLNVPSTFPLAGHYHRLLEGKAKNMDEASVSYIPCRGRYDCNSKRASTVFEANLNMPVVENRNGITCIKQCDCRACSYRTEFRSAFEKHMGNNTGERPFKCYICSSSFRYSSSLKIHIRKHTGERPFKCNICSSSFRHNSHMKRHMQKHTGERPFECNICLRSFGQNYSLKIHMQKHTGERPFKCNICSSSFRHNSHLKMHMVKHTGERLFKCNTCSSSFRYSSSLKIHIRKHTGERPFECSICSRSFSQKSNLKRHIRKHTGERPFKCNVCSSSFPDYSNLKRHMRKHTGERPFECNICSRSFSRTCSIKIHMRKHTGERPFKCNICSRSFSHSSNLKQHIRKHTKERSFKCNIFSEFQPE